MKRPQFSVLLLLLVTALIAVVIAWRQAASLQNQTENSMEFERLKHDIQILDDGKATNKPEVIKLRARLKDIQK